MKELSETEKNHLEEIPSSSEGALLYDTPLIDPEDDRLERAGFAKFLADAIMKMDADEGFVFALNGPWGSGKTTVINFALHYLNEEQKDTKTVVPIHFNPWWFSGKDQLLQQFFCQMRSSLGKEDIPASLKSISSKLDTFSKVLVPLTFIPVAGEWIARIQNVFQSSAKAAGKVSESLEEDAKGARESIDIALRAQNARLLIVIDDIDRLNAEEIRQLFQLVKSVADFPKTIYLLAFDQNVVFRALTDVQKAPGREYLEKIVQAPFDLPPPSRHGLRQFLFEQLDEVVHGTPDNLWDDTEWGNLYWDGVDKFIRNPRDIKRLINVLRPSYPIVKGEVNLIDFIGLQSLRIFAREIYQYVAENKNDLTGTDNDTHKSQGKIEEKQQFYESLINEQPIDIQSAVKNIMVKMFPRWESVFGNVHYDSSRLSTWRKNRRICSPDVFDVYFQLSISSGDISAIEMRAILSTGGNKEAFANELLRLNGETRPDGTNRLDLFFEQMEDYTGEDIPIKHIESIVSVLYDIGDQVTREKDRRGMFDLGIDMKVMRVSRQLVNRLPSQEERFELLSKVLRKGKAVSIIVQRVIISGQEHGRRTPNEPRSPVEERLVSEKHQDKFEEIALERIREAMREGKLHLVPNFSQTLHALINWGSEKEARQYVSDLLKGDKGLCSFIEGFLGASFSHGIGDRIAKKTWRISIDAMKTFIEEEPESFMPRCDQLLSEPPDWLTDRQRIALETFLKKIREPLDSFGEPIQ